MDYFPFGEIRLDTKPANSTLNEQRKYIGQEYDVETGLNYLNARYYNSAIARFTSQDPMFWNFNADWLSDPQNQNAYAYARNNPIIGSDPTGLIVVTVSGTQPFGSASGKSDYLKDNTVLQNNISNSFKGQDVYNFSGWTGGDNDAARKDGANNFSSFVNETMKNYSASEPLNVVCHSHGCNVVALYTQQSDSHQIENMVSFARPMLKAYTEDQNKIDNNINVYSKGDKVQRFAGNQTSMSAAIGGLFLGIPGFIIGSIMNWNEIGWAGRTTGGANNQNATQYQENWYRWINNHGEIFENQNVWDNNVYKFIKN